MDNNVCSGLRPVTCPRFFVWLRISNRKIIYFDFPSDFRNRKDLDQCADYVNRLSNRLRVMNCDRVTNKGECFAPRAFQLAALWNKYFSWENLTFPRSDYSERYNSTKKGKDRMSLDTDFVDKSILSKASAAFNSVPLLTLLHLVIYFTHQTVWLTAAESLTRIVGNPTA